MSGACHLCPGCHTDVGCCGQTVVRTDFLRCIVNIFRIEIGAAFFIPCTTIFCVALWTSMGFRFVPQVPTTLRTSPLVLRPPYSRPSHHSLPHPPLTPAHLTPLALPSPRKYHCLRWLFRRRHLGRHLQCVFCARSQELYKIKTERKLQSDKPEHRVLSFAENLCAPFSVKPQIYRN